MEFVLRRHKILDIHPEIQWQWESACRIRTKVEAASLSADGRRSFDSELELRHRVRFFLFFKQTYDSKLARKALCLCYLE